MSYGTRYVPMSFFDSLAHARLSLRENSLKALETQIELIEFLNRPSSHTSLFRLVDAYYGSDDQRPTSERVERAAWLHAQMSQIVGSATTYYVSEDMCEMVKLAAEDMRRFASEGLSPKDIPTPTGFLVFAKPMQVAISLRLEEDDGTERWINETHAFAAISWANTMVGLTNEGIFRRSEIKKSTVIEEAPGIVYHLYETPHDLAACLNMAYTDRSALTEGDIRGMFGPLPLYDWSGWAYGMPWLKTDVTAEEFTMVEGASVVATSVDAIRRVLLATWKLLGEQITTVESNRPPRHIRRRAERVAPETGDVLIVRLRKEITDRRGDAPAVPLLEGQEAGEDEPWYTHRFLVAGHWKHQPYGPHNSLRKLKWIAPYIKGPVGAPLVHRDRIYSLEA